MPTESGQPRIFLSYAHADQAPAQRLASALQRCGYTVWWDALIEGGTQYARSIDDALQAADVVIVLWSRSSIHSDWVRDEAAQGRDRHRLVPLSLDGTMPPLGFRQYQVIDVSGWRGRGDAPQFASVRRAVDTALGQEVERQAIAPGVTRRKAMVGAAAAVAVAGGGTLAAWKSGMFGADAGGTQSIAVLPFKNLSVDAGQAHLSDALTEEIRSGLSRNAGLLVLAATSSNAAGDITGGAKAISQKLGVTYLLEGSVQRAGDMVRVATNLTNGRTGFTEWSQRVDRRLGDIFAFESEIAHAVSDAISAKMARETAAPGGTRNAEAYDAFSKGRALYNLAKDEESDRQARAYYELAIASDDNFALAHAGLSRVLSSIAAAHADATELKPLYAAAIVQARRAIQLAPTMAEGHLALGYALFAGRLDIRNARPAYERAYKLGWGNSDIVLLYALFSVRTRRFAEARTAIERALTLDPLNPRTHRAAGTVAFTSRRYADAIAQYQRALELNPQMSNAHALMGDALMELGKMDDARRSYVAEPAAMFRLRGQAILEHRAGDRAKAEQAFRRLVTEVGDAALYQQAEVMAQWGRTDEALRKLYQARTIGDSGVSLVASDPLLDPISRDPRFLRFVQEVGFA